jgi:hypothetical protein
VAIDQVGGETLGGTAFSRLPDLGPPPAGDVWAA